MQSQPLAASDGERIGNGSRRKGLMRVPLWIKGAGGTEGLERRARLAQRSSLARAHIQGLSAVEACG
jgi:hypothetical protein